VILDDRMTDQGLKSAAEGLALVAMGNDLVVAFGD
jgi:hypothetical protein